MLEFKTKEMYFIEFKYMYGKIRCLHHRILFYARLLLDMNNKYANVCTCTIHRHPNMTGDQVVNGYL